MFSLFLPCSDIALGLNHCWWHWTADHTSRWAATVGCPVMMDSVWHVTEFQTECYLHCSKTTTDIHSYISQLMLKTF